MWDVTLQEEKIIASNLIIKFTKKIGREKKTRQTLLNREILRDLVAKNMLENIPLPEDSAYESYEVWLKVCERRVKYNLTVLKNIHKAKDNVWALQSCLRKLEAEEQKEISEQIQAVGQTFSFEKKIDRKVFGRNSHFEFSRGQVLFLRRKR